MPKVSCPHCNTALKVPEAAAGKLGKCPKCAMKFVVDFAQPGKVEILDDPPAAQASPPPPPEVGYDLAGLAQGETTSQAPLPPAAIMPQAAPAPGVFLPATQAAGAKPLGLKDHFALKVASLALCVIVAAGWLLPWAKPIDQRSQYRYMIGGPTTAVVTESRIGAKAFWESLSWLQTDSKTVNSTGACVGFMIFAIGSLAALATALFSLADWKMSRTAPPAGVAALGLAVMLIFWPSKGMVVMVTPYLILAAAVIACIIGLISLDWSGLSRKFSNSAPVPGGPSLGARLAANPLQVAALALNLLLMVPLFLPWAKITGNFPKSACGASFVTDLSRERQSTDDVRARNATAADALDKAQTAQSLCSWGGLVFGIGSLAAGVIALTSVSLGSWRLRVAGIGGGLGLLGVLLMSIGLMLGNSALKDIKAISQIHMYSPEITFAWGLAAAGVVALASLGTNIGSHEA